MLNSPVSRRSSSAWSSPRLSGANDNSRLRLVPPMGRGAPSRIVRLNPYLGAVGIALGVLDFYLNNKPESWGNLGAWSLVAEAPIKSPLYTLDYGKGGANSVVNSPSLISATLAGTTGQATTFVGDPWAGVLNTHRTVIIGRTREINGTSRMQCQLCFSRPNQGAFVKPVFQPAHPAVALPPNPAITRRVTENPMNAKPDEAPAFTRPIPWSALPNTAPSTGREASYGEPDLKPLPSAPYAPSKVPNEWSVSISHAPQGQAVPSAPKTHTMAPPRSKPPKRENEVKHKLPTSAIKILKAVSAVTEAIDFVDALYKALPSEYRPRYRNTMHEKRVTTPTERMEAVIKNAEKIDIYDAIDNLVENQIEDYVFGKVGQAAGEASKQVGLNYGMGFNTINRQFQKSWYQLRDGAKISVYGG